MSTTSKGVSRPVRLNGRQKYTPEFKEQTVRMVTEGGVSIAQAARDLGLAESQIYRWKKALAESSVREGTVAFPGNGNPKDAELARLRRENEQLRQEREILKKAISIFSPPRS